MTRNTLPSFFSGHSNQMPFFENLQKEMEQVFDLFRSPSNTALHDQADRSTGWITPAVDIAETDCDIEITAEIPGVSDSDLDISIFNGVLTIKGEKSSDREEKEKDYHLVERRYGSFHRRIPLGFSPSDDAVSAKFSDGILNIKIHKPEDEKETVQTIKIEGS